MFTYLLQRIMKHYVRLRSNQFVMLDSYKRCNKLPIASITFFLLTSFMMAVVIGAAMGTDITSPLSPSAHQHQQR